MEFCIERAKLSDMPEVHKMITYFADRDEMLHRPLSELFENVRDYYVIKENDAIIACGSLHVVWDDLAEVKAVAVREDYQSQGLGKLIVNKCIDEAREMGIATVFCLTIKPGYYEQVGFLQNDVMTLPRKVWGECLRCSKFPHCNEIAMVLHLRPGGAASLVHDPSEGMPIVSFPIWEAAGRSG